MPIVNMVEMIPESLHDTIELPNGPTTKRFQFFCKPIGFDKADQVFNGDGDSWFTRWLRTNMLTDRTLPAPREFLVKRLNVMFLCQGRPLRIYDTDLYGKTSIDFSVNQKSYWKSPAWKCANAFAVFGDKKEITTFGPDWKDIGATFDREVLWNLNVAIDGVLLSWKEFFSVEADIAADIPPNMQLCVDLDGVGSREIQ